MRILIFLLLLAACLVPVRAIAQTPIHQCKDADGGIVYSQLPCKDEEPAEERAAADSAATDSPEPETTTVEIYPPASSETESESGESRAACKKRYRDAIDAIDAEIRSEYSAEKDGEYKQRLLALTRKLRECGSG